MDRKMKPVGIDKDGEKRFACGLEILKKSLLLLMHTMLEGYSTELR